MVCSGAAAAVRSRLYLSGWIPKLGAKGAEKSGPTRGTGTGWHLPLLAAAELSLGIAEAPAAEFLRGTGEMGASHK